MFIIGDVHGKIKEYNKILKSLPPNSTTIQVGDFGFKEAHDWFLRKVKGNHFIVFGNHDYLPYLTKPYSLKNAFAFLDYRLLTIRGAESIDKYMRILGRDYFDNEELNWGEWNEVFDYYETMKPEIIISHECPDFVSHTLFGIYQKSITRSNLGQLHQLHQPKIWIFGHHHHSKDVVIKGTRFICLKELEVLDLNKILNENDT